MSDPIRDEYERRIAYEIDCSKSKELAAAEYELCRRDVSYFINNWCFTFDPRRKPKHFPFSLYEYQKEAIEWLNARYSKKEIGLIEKSRDLGATWIVSAWAVHGWLFEPGFSALFGSRKEDLVDDKTLDSIFGKLRYLIYRLPHFLKPPISARSKNDRYMAIVNPINDNEIVGESANPGFGRGGRKSICFLDEFAHVQHSEAVWASISDNSECIIPLSTPNGKGNQFAWLRHDANLPVLSLHWSKHPLKTRDWYEDKKKTMLPWQVAQELDLSYERSVAGRVYSRFDREYHVASQKIVFDPEAEQFVCWDFGQADPTAILWGQITLEGEIQIWNCFEMSGEDIDFFAPISQGKAPINFFTLPQETKDLINKALSKVPMNHKASHFGDHGGTQRTANSKRSCRDALKSHDVDLKTSGKQTFDWRIECLDNLFKLRQNKTTGQWYSIFKVSPDCSRLIDCLFNYQWDADDLNKEGIKPKHDWASHMVTALEFFAINRFPVRKSGGYREQVIR